MTTSNINRRTALLGTATLPAALAPVAAMANPSMSTGRVGADPDPAVLAFHEWREAVLANEADPHDHDSPEGAPFYERYRAANEAMFDVVPTTPEGLACKARFTAEVCGDMRAYGDPSNPEDYRFFKWANGEELRFINSLLAYTERLAGRAV